MKSESLTGRAASNLSGRHVSGGCLCGAVELEIDFPAFWAWHDHSAASRRVHGAAYATYIGCWRKHARVAKGRRSITRFGDATTETTRSFCARWGTPLLYERKRSPHIVNIPRALFTGRTGREPRYHVAIEELQDWAYTGNQLVPNIYKGAINSALAAGTRQDLRKATCRFRPLARLRSSPPQPSAQRCGAVKHRLRRPAIGGVGANSVFKQTRLGQLDRMLVAVLDRAMDKLVRLQRRCGSQRIGLKAGLCRACKDRSDRGAHLPQSSRGTYGSKFCTAVVAVMVCTSGIGGTSGCAISTRANAAVCLLIASSASVASARLSTADVKPGRSFSPAPSGPFCLPGSTRGR